MARTRPPLISARGRYAPPRRGEDTSLWDIANDVSLVFALPGTWVDLDVTTMDYFSDTGEVSWLPNPLGLAFQELEITYTAGFATIPDPVKFACAQIVRNAQATPGAERPEQHVEQHASGLFCRHAAGPDGEELPGAVPGAEGGMKWRIHIFLRRKSMGSSTWPSVRLIA